MLESVHYIYTNSTSDAALTTTTTTTTPTMTHSTQTKSLDTELMMHWCNSTYRTVSTDPNVQRLWQTTIPREAMHHQFLRHGLLAVSALDRARSVGPGRSCDEHLRVAQMHHTHAMTGLTAARKTNPQTQSQSNAIFVVSCTTILYEMAYPLNRSNSSRVSPSDDSTLSDLCSVIEQSREAIAIMGSVLDEIRDGDLHLLTRKDDALPKMPDTSRLVMLSLRRLNGSLAGSGRDHETAVYEATMEHLGSALERLAGGSEPGVIALRWMQSIPARFIELVRTRRPFALVLLAHFAVVLHSLRVHWWMGDWGMRVLEAIGHSLDPEWRPYLCWVVDATGWHIA